MNTLNIRPLNSNLRGIACDELNEEPEKIQDFLGEIREWIKKSEHLTARTDDQFLVSFLRGCKYSLERTKKKLDMYYTIRTHAPDLIKDRDPMEVRSLEIIKIGVILPLPIQELHVSPRILLLRLGIIDTNKYTMHDMSRVLTMIYDILMIDDDNTVVSGLTFIVDLSGINLAHVTQLQPALIKKLALMWQDGLPFRQKGLHYINGPKFFEQIINLVKSVMNEKLRSRVFIHSSMESLYKEIPRELLPSEYGGEAGSIETLTEVWKNKIISNRQYYLDESKYGVDEKKRIGQSTDYASLYGLDGSFRQLDVD